MKIISKQFVVATMLLAGASGIALTSSTKNRDNVSSEKTMEYMDKNPKSQAARAGF